MTRLSWPVILKRRATDLFDLPVANTKMATILVDEILRSLRSLQDDKIPRPRRNEARFIRSGGTTQAAASQA
ncbi:MAG: hypothetical protein ABI718_12040 [Acidobacteriota bacterium]